MSRHPLSEATYRRELGGGLVLRWSTAADADGVAQLYSHVFRDGPDQPFNTFTAAWSRELMSGEHPLIGPGDFALVEDTDRGAIVAATCLMSQVWEYAGIPFPVGRPEIVASDPEYRNRGLVRAVFELVHARSAAEGHMAQGITGIPYYYRQFGYEYALDLGGSRSMYFSSIPRLKPGEPESCELREATPEDLPLVQELYDRERGAALVSTRMDERYWRFTLSGRSVEAGEGWRILIIAATGSAGGLGEAGEPLGYLLLKPRRWNDAIVVESFAVKPGISLMAVLPPVLRALPALAPSVMLGKPDLAPAERIAFGLGGAHPIYEALGENVLTGRRSAPYAWYVRVHDLPAFIHRIAPVLERRLAGSLAAGHSGELKLDFYRGGLRLAFEGGRLSAAEHWRAPVWSANAAQGGFPPLVFLQLLFGHRSLAELRQAFPDVWANDDTTPLLEALFPKQRSWVLPLD